MRFGRKDENEIFFQFLGKKKTLITIIGLFVVATVASAAYFYLGKYGADTTQTVEIVNQAKMSYLDSQNNLVNINSNAVNIRIVEDGPVTPDLTFAYEGWYLITLAKQPTDPRISSIFKNACFPPNPNDTESYIDIGNQRLIRWDTLTQGQNIFDCWTEDDFGPYEIGKGYWVIINSEDAGESISYEGTVQTEDIMVDLSITEGSGMALLGNPFNKDINFGDEETKMSNVFFEKNGVFKTYSEASTGENPWVDGYSWWWDTTIPGGALTTVASFDHWPDTTFLKPWNGFWLTIRDSSNLKIHFKYNASQTW